jgi:hypothetical protein
MTPDDITEAARNCDIDAVAEWLAAHPQSVNDVDEGGASLLLLCVDHCYEHIEVDQDDQLEMIRYLLSQGADPNHICHIGPGESQGTMTPLYAACGGCNTPLVKELVAYLLRTGADPNVKTKSPGMRMSPLACAIDTFFVSSDGSWQLPVVALLLRAGASLDHCSNGQLADELIAEEELYQDTLVARNVHFRAAAQIVRAVRAAGSWKKYCRRRRRSPHRDVLGLRSLAMRGYITPCQKRRTHGTEWKAIVAFVARLGDNGVVWNILSFWRDPDDIEDIVVQDEYGDPEYLYNRPRPPVRVYD